MTEMKDKLDKLPIVNSLQSLEQRALAMSGKLAYCLLLGPPISLERIACAGDDFEVSQ